MRKSKTKARIKKNDDAVKQLKAVDRLKKAVIMSSAARVGKKVVRTGKFVKKHGKRLRTAYKIVNAIGKLL